MILDNRRYYFTFSLIFTYNSSLNRHYLRDCGFNLVLPYSHGFYRFRIEREHGFKIDTHSSGKDLVVEQS